ncbi:MAG: geranylgeranylglycerol-phosphate geranylgeranyltransferase [Saprospiraceae bacterium]
MRAENFYQMQLNGLLAKRNYIRIVHFIKNLIYIVRLPNLIMLAGIQALIYFRLLDPEKMHLSMSLFFGLSFITVLIAAGGYVINDYYDRDIDKINKPGKVIAGTQWSLPEVKILYFILVCMGAILSVIFSLQLNLAAYLFIYPIAVCGLWFYSFALKCWPVLGNLWVALFCAGVVGIVVLPDRILNNTQHIKIEVWYYIAFAFLSTWYREVVKDIEDMEGDKEAGCNTFLVSFGVNAGKMMALILCLFLITSLIVWDSSQSNRWIKSGLVALQGLTVASMAFVWWARNNTFYHYASNVIKLVMLLGTALLLIPQ